MKIGKIATNDEEKKKLEEEAARLYSRARSKLVLRSDSAHVFFATLALRLQYRARWDIPTAATDGDYIYVNPIFWCSLTDKQREGVLCHEVLHPALLHHTRRMGRDPKKWNIAADAAINPIVKASGLELPDDCVFPGKPPLKKAKEGLTTEEYYHLIDMSECKNGGEKGGGEDGDGEGCGDGDFVLIGDVMDANTENGKTPADSEEEWQQHTAAAHEAARRKGNMPGWMEQVVLPSLKPVVDWKQQLAEFLKSKARNDYRWNPPNRRYIWNDVYLPALGGEQIGDVVIFVDTSGSCWDPETLSSFAAEMQGVLDAYECKLHIAYADTEVQKTETWEPSDGELKLRVVGGGGTSHVDCWRWLREQEFEASCAICLTDGYTEWGDEPPLPILWALTVRSVKPPFGRTLYIDRK